MTVFVSYKIISRMASRRNVESVRLMYVVSHENQFENLVLKNILQASEAAIALSDEFAGSMHWATYRASKQYCSHNVVLD